MKLVADTTPAGPSATCAIIVSYHPDELIVELTQKLLQQLPQVVIVDNGSGPRTQPLLQGLARDARVHLIGNPHNLGIAAALNQGVRFAQEKRYTWVATFDQDSQITGDYFSRLFEALRRTPLAGKIAILAPRYADPRTGVTSSFVGHRRQQSDGVTPIEITMTSGNLVRCSAFQRAGMFCEELFIDYVDYEFCLRCQRHGMLIMEVANAILIHRPGHAVRLRFLWMNPVLRRYQPVRRYYNARNRVAVYRRHGWRHVRWVGCDLWELIRETAKVALLEDQKVQKLQAVLRGILHGLCGRMGKISNEDQVNGAGPACDS